MPGLKPPVPFRRKRRGLPGQSSDEDLDATIIINVKEGDSGASIINKALILIGDPAAGRYVRIDATGVHLHMEENAVVQMSLSDGDDVIGKVYSQIDTNTSHVYLYSLGKDGDNPEASVFLQAVTHDGTPHNGASDVTIQASTYYDRISLGATSTYVLGQLVLNTYTTAQRNALSPVNGTLIYNTTASKIQAYAGSAWVDLH